MIPLAKPHGICVRSKKRHAAGASGVPLRFTAMVSQGGGGLSPMSETPGEGTKRVSRLMSDDWYMDVKISDGISGFRLTIERKS